MQTLPDGGTKYAIEVTTLNDRDIELPSNYTYAVVPLRKGLQATLTVDTGNNTSFLYLSAARRLGLDIATTPVGDVVGWGDGVMTRVMGHASLADFRLGFLHLDKLVLEVRDDLTSPAEAKGYLNGLHQHFCDGTLGTDLLNKMDWCVLKRERDFRVYAAGALDRGRLNALGFRVSTLRAANDGSLRVSAKVDGTEWEMAVDSGASHCLYADAVSRRGFQGSLRRMSDGRQCLIAEVLSVAGVEFVHKVVKVGPRIGKGDEDGLLGGNLFENAAICVSVANEILGVSKVTEIPSPDDLDAVIPYLWQQAQESANAQDYGSAARIFNEVARFLSAAKGKRAVDGYLRARLAQAGALTNNYQDAEARQLLIEIKSKDPAFMPEQINELEKALK